MTKFKKWVHINEDGKFLLLSEVIGFAQAKTYGHSWVRNINDATVFDNRFNLKKLHLKKHPECVHRLPVEVIRVVKITNGDYDDNNNKD